MTDRPIIFSAPMVRALLAGAKTQTRRLATSPLRRCEAGDRLYVREGWAVKRCEPCAEHERDWQSLSRPTISYLADGVEIAHIGDRRTGEGIYHGPVEQGRPSIHMPRWASRLTLIVEAARVEHLQAISGHDARCEGVERAGEDRWRDYGRSDGKTDLIKPRESYASLWESLHGAGSWRDNPDVLVLSFRVERGNIDRIGA